MLDVFRVMLREPNTIRQSHFDLMFQSNPTQLCSDILSLFPICDEAEKNLSKLIIVYLDKKLGWLAENQYSQHKDWLLQLCESVLLDKNIAYGAKKLLQDWLTKLLYELQLEDRSEEFCDSREFAWISNLVTKISNSQNQDTRLAAVTVLEALTTVQYNQQHKYIIYKETLAAFVDLGNSLYDRLKQLQEELLELLGNEHKPMPRVLTDLYKALTIQANYLQDWTKCCYHIIEVMIEVSVMNSNLEVSVYMDLAGNVPLQNVFKGVLGLVISAGTQQEGTIFSTCGVQQSIDQVLNDVKALALKTHTMLIDDLKRLEPEDTLISERVMYSEISKMIPAILQSLLLLGRQTDPHPTNSNKNIVRAKIDRYSLEKVVSESLRFLESITRLPFCYSAVNETYQQLFEVVLLPLVSDDLDVLDEIRENPENYYAYCIDLTQDREYKSQQNCTADLIEAFCRKLDGSLPWIVHSCIEALFASINDHKINRESRFKVLSILSYLISDRKELLDETHHLLLKMELIGQLTPNELVWYYVLLDFNLEDVIALAPAEYSALMINAMATPDSDPTSSYIFDLMETILRIAPNQELWQKMFDRISDTKSIRYFESLEKVLSKSLQWDTLPEAAVVNFVQSLLKKLEAELAASPNRVVKWGAISQADRRDAKLLQRMDSILVYKILNIVIELSSQVHYLQGHREVVDALQPVLEYLWVENILFDDKITRVLMNILKVSIRLDAAEFRYLQRLPTVFKRYGVYKYIYYILEEYLTKGAEYIGSRPQLLGYVMELVEAGMASKSTYVLGQACTLYQLCLRTMLTERIPQEAVSNWKYAYDVTRDLYLTGKTDNEFKPKLLCKLANCWLWAIPYHHQIDIQFLIECYQDCLRPEDSYNCKVFLSGLERLLSNNILCQSRTLAKFLVIAVVVLENILLEATKKQQEEQRVRRGKNSPPKEDQDKSGNPYGSTDIFQAFRSILLLAQQSVLINFAEVMDETSAQGVSFDRLKVLARCMTQDNKPRRYLKVDRSKHGYTDRLEQC